MKEKGTRIRVSACLSAHALKVQVKPQTAKIHQNDSNGKTIRLVLLERRLKRGWRHDESNVLVDNPNPKYDRMYRPATNRLKLRRASIYIEVGTGTRTIKAAARLI